MVGRELHTVCPNGEDHQGRIDDVKKSGSGSRGDVGRNRDDLKSWTRTTMMVGSLAGMGMFDRKGLRVMNCISRAWIWVFIILEELGKSLTGKTRSPLAKHRNGMRETLETCRLRLGIKKRC